MITNVLLNPWTITIVGGVIVVLVTHYVFGVGKKSYGGGKGGNVKVIGNNAVAIGGKGGGGGPGGKGGDGASVEVFGDNAFAMGGEGGEAGQTDRGGRGGRGPLHVLMEDYPEKFKEISETFGITEEVAKSIGGGGNGEVGKDLLQKKWWKRPEVIIPIVIALISIPWWPSWLGYKTEQKVTQSHTGSGDNILGDKNVTYSVATLPSRELNEQIASCILDQLSEIGGKRVSFELYGSWMTVKNETGGGMFGQPPDNETVNFTKEVANLLKENNYQVDETYTSISSFSVDEAAFTGFLIKRGNEEDAVSIHIGPNDGRQITCI